LPQHGVRLSVYPTIHLLLLYANMAAERVIKAAEKLVELFWEAEKEIFLVRAEDWDNEFEFRRELTPETDEGMYHLIVILASGDSGRIEQIIEEMWHERNWRYAELPDYNR